MTAVAPAQTNASITGAWSPGKNLAALFARQQDAFDLINGLRSMSFLWILIFHTCYSYGMVAGKESVFALGEASPLLWWIFNADKAVDLFFILSGFLISLILFKEVNRTGTIRLGRFYFRRYLRLTPVYALILFLYWLSGGRNHEYVWANLFYVNNFLEVDQMALQWTWTLAVEEQFYLLWPLLVFTVNRKALVWICLGLIALSPAFRFYLTLVDVEHYKLTAYVWTPARLDALAMGALLALAVRSGSTVFKSARLMLALGMIAALYIAITIVTQYWFLSVATGWPILNQSFCALLFVVLIYFCLDLKGNQNPLTAMLKSALSGQVIRSIGKYSYAIYVFHLPVSLLLRAHVHPYIEPHVGNFSISGISLLFVVEAGLLLAVTYLLARISWMLVEKPCLALKHRWPMTEQRPAMPAGVPA